MERWCSGEGQNDEARVFCFFFSSRRRHTRFDCDWSSDVCSSDLATQLTVTPSAANSRASNLAAAVTADRSTTEAARSGRGWRTAADVTNTTRPKLDRKSVV